MRSRTAIHCSAIVSTEICAVSLCLAIITLSLVISVYTTNLACQATGPPYCTGREAGDQVWRRAEHLSRKSPQEPVCMPRYGAYSSIRNVILIVSSCLLHQKCLCSLRIIYSSIGECQLTRPAFGLSQGSPA